jgi:Rps23 Pro-64 3,4-dihydroxylase Tpa1-like proline 4-hydroxylase
VYYLNNECNGGYGGETAIYHNGNVVDTVTPKNNRLFAFEVAPDSYHGFLTNLKYERCSLTQWFHQDPALTFSRFNAENSPW